MQTRLQKIGECHLDLGRHGVIRDGELCRLESRDFNVLKQLDDPSSLGHAIAAAFMATLWGLLSSNVFFLPLGGKLVTKTEEEVAYREMLIEGILGIQGGENPRMLREKLNAFVLPKDRQTDDGGAGS